MDVWLAANPASSGPHREQAILDSGHGTAVLTGSRYKGLPGSRWGRNCACHALVKAASPPQGSSHPQELPSCCRQELNSLPPTLGASTGANRAALSRPVHTLVLAAATEDRVPQGHLVSCTCFCLGTCPSSALRPCTWRWRPLPSPWVSRGPGLSSIEFGTSHGDWLRGGHVTQAKPTRPNHS